MLYSYYGDKGHVRGPLLDRQLHESSYARGRPFPMFRGATAKPHPEHTPYQLRNLITWRGRNPQASWANWDAFRQPDGCARRACACRTAESTLA